MWQVFICEYRVEQEKWDGRFGLLKDGAEG